MNKILGYLLIALVFVIIVPGLSEAQRGMVMRGVCIALSGVFAIIAVRWIVRCMNGIHELINRSFWR